ncbi:hypothetical protein U2F10_15745 [Leptothoe sp. EHU-05/26/07-4]
MMTGIDDQNPLRTQLENDLSNSEWLQKFKAINQLLHSLKAEILEIQSCELKWDTHSNGLVIHCPSVDIAQQLQSQQHQIITIASYANCITLVHPGSSDIILKA